MWSSSVDLTTYTCTRVRSGPTRRNNNDDVYTFLTFVLQRRRWTICIPRTLLSLWNKPSPSPPPPVEGYYHFSFVSIFCFALFRGGNKLKDFYAVTVSDVVRSIKNAARTVSSTYSYHIIISSCFSARLADRFLPSWPDWTKKKKKK